MRQQRFAVCLVFRGEMTHNSPHMAAQLIVPRQPRTRLVGIDVLRGVAILGILVMNVQSFAMPVSAYSYPWSWGNMSGFNGVVYYGSHVLASGKFISIFAMLFGAGIVLQTQKPNAEHSAAAIHFRRMFGLLAFGMVHAYLIWYGDILFSYALLGMLAFAFHRCSPRVLVWAAIGFFLAGVVMNVLIGIGLYFTGLHADAGIIEEFNPSFAVQLAEVEAYRGSWTEQLKERLPISLFSQTYILVTYCLPLVTGLMLAGMALLKSGFYHFAWSRAAYVRIAIAGTLIGWALSTIGLLIDARTGNQPVLSAAVWFHINTLAMAPTAIGYSAAVLLLANSSLAAKLWPLAAVGRTALSCYLLESLICTTLFYGHGLGWFGSVERGGQLVIVVCVWIAVIAFAVSWTRLFRFGPAEWIWRGMTYGFAHVRA
jgi:uncharacterized protein